jgi:hypothetical protein
MGCRYCEREECDTDCSFQDRHGGTSRKTAAEWRTIGANEAGGVTVSDDDTRPFSDFLSDIVKPRPGGGCTIDIDHPNGRLLWDLPEERAGELMDAIGKRLRVSEPPRSSDLLPHARVNCDREICKAFVDVGHQVSRDALAEALRALGWTVQSGGAREYHWCGECEVGKCEDMEDREHVTIKGGRP